MDPLDLDAIHAALREHNISQFEIDQVDAELIRAAAAHCDDPENNPDPTLEVKGPCDHMIPCLEFDETNPCPNDEDVICLESDAYDAWGLKAFPCYDGVSEETRDAINECYAKAYPE